MQGRAPSRTSHKIVQSDMRTLVTNIEVRERRLLRRFSQDQVREIDEEFAVLARAYRMKPAMKTASDRKVSRSVSFVDGWAPVAGRFPKLKEFRGGIATVFSNSTTVEADFTLLGLEKNKYRKASTDLPLEGVPNNKQFLNLVALWSLILNVLRM